MEPINKQLYVGTVDDFHAIVNNCPPDARWSILGACKEPLHRKYAKIQGADYSGYVGRAMPKDEPEYLFAKREHALYCNLIDAPDMKYIPDEIIHECIKFIDTEMDKGRKVLIVCNKAESRSPSIALMWLIHIGTFNFLPEDKIIDYFTRAVYSNYKPSKGFQDYVLKYWRWHMENVAPEQIEDCYGKPKGVEDK